MQMPLTYVHLQRHNVVPVNLNFDPSVAAVDDKAAKAVARRVLG